MGLNVDLVCMLGIDDCVKCPRCQKENTQSFDDYDIECGNCNNDFGEWKLDCYCANCEYEWSYCFKLKVTEEENEEH